MSARLRRTPLFGQDGHLGIPLVIQVSTVLVKYPEHFSSAQAHFQNLESNINRPYGSLRTRIRCNICHQIGVVKLKLIQTNKV